MSHLIHVKGRSWSLTLSASSLLSGCNKIVALIDTILLSEHSVLFARIFLQFTTPVQYRHESAAQRVTNLYKYLVAVINQ